MNPLRSIRVRLLGLIGLLLLLVLGGFGYVAWHRESAARMAAVDRELQERLNLLITGFRPAEGQRLDAVSQPRLSPRGRELFENEGGKPFYYQVWLGDGRVQARSPQMPEIALPAPTDEANALRTRDHFREIIHFTPTSRCFLIGRSIEDELASMRADAISLAAFGGGALLAGLALAWWIAARVTRPLVQVSQAARQIAAGDLSQRVQLAGTKDELDEVALVLNDTFARLESAFVRQKQFTADASHELRTPVALILAHAQGALMHEQSVADYREALTDIEGAAKRMRAIIESLLELARFDAGLEQTKQERCDLAILTHDCLAMLGPLVDAKRIKLKLDLQPAVCSGSPTRLAQVITNLLTNAIHFTPLEGAIELRTLQSEGAIFTITDTGTGIAADELPLLFDRFHRVDASRARNSGGIGLGLAICKAIITAHGGHIEVQSQIDAGASFTIVLPPESFQERVPSGG